MARHNFSTMDERDNDSFPCSDVEYDKNLLMGEERSINIYSNPDDEHAVDKAAEHQL